MIYKVNNEIVTQNEFESRLEDAVREYVEFNYDDILDECYEEVKIGCCTFYPSQILKELDPIAYECGIDDEVDARLSDALYDFREPYYDDIAGTSFETLDEEDDEDYDEDYERSWGPKDDEEEDDD